MLLKVVSDNSNLREHQADAKKKIYEAWRKCNSVMLQMPTGTGKTYLFTSIINDLVRTYKEAKQEINILVVAHRMELLDQISETLDRFGIPHGFIQGAREQHLWRRVQVGSIMSLLTEKNFLNTLRQRFDYIIVDEAHHSLSDTYVELFNQFPNAKKLGVTATPWRFNHESFLKLYQELIQSPQISWFIQKGLLADFEYVSIKPDSEIQRLVNNSEVSPTGDFVNSDLDNVFNNQRIRSKLYESYVKFANGRKGIIYAINKIHAARIAELYCSHGVKAVAIDCDTPKEERKRLINLFKVGEIKVLVNVEIFTEGFDCPDVNFIQLARPTRSLALFLQQVGRGLRIVQGKDKTIILDNVGLYNYFGLPDANRKWYHHFKGIDDATKIDSHGRKRNEPLDFTFDETKLDEEDEPMMIVRGANSNIVNETETNDNSETSKKFQIEEFSVANYYLVCGTRLSFKIYPLMMKKGKSTGGIGSCVYEYTNEKPIIFWHDSKVNFETLNKNVKLQTILMFVANRLGIDINNIYDIDALSTLTNTPIGECITIFDLLKLLNDYDFK